MREFRRKHNGLIRALFWVIVLVIVVLTNQRASKPVIFEPEFESATQTILPTKEPDKTTALEPIEKFEMMSAPVETTPIAPEPSKEPEIEPRYGFTDDEVYLLAVLLSGSKNVDGDGEYDVDFNNDERYDQISLVFCVVMNRVRDERFPNTVSEVVWAPGQFSLMPSWKDGLPEVSDISLQRTKEWCEAYDRHDTGIQNIPEDHVFFSGDGYENHSRASYR